MRISRNTSSILTLVFLSLLLLSSCSEHEDAWYGNASAGSILLSDNTIISPDRYDALSMTAIGVVIGSRQDTAWVVSTHELGLKSYSDTLVSVSGVSSDLSALNGRENTAALLNSDFACDGASAVSSMESTVSGWSLPSAGELRMLAASLSTVTSSMLKIGGEGFKSSPYLSSTQDGSSSETEKLYACCVTLQTGYVSTMLKTNRALVRPIMRIKTS